MIQIHQIVKGRMNASWNIHLIYVVRDKRQFILWERIFRDPAKAKENFLLPIIICREMESHSLESAENFIIREWTKTDGKMN
jgi:hypothetical protein